VRTYAAWRRVRREDAFAYARRVLVNYLTDKWRGRLKEYPPATCLSRAPNRTSRTMSRQFSGQRDRRREG
jgi:hypothetical protein